MARVAERLELEQNIEVWNQINAVKDKLNACISDVKYLRDSFDKYVASEREIQEGYKVNMKKTFEEITNSVKHLERATNDLKVELETTNKINQAIEQASRHSRNEVLAAIRNLLLIGSPIVATIWFFIDKYFKHTE